MKNRNELVSVIAVFCCLMIAFHTGLVSAAEQTEQQSPITIALAGADEKVISISDNDLEQVYGGHPDWDSFRSGIYDGAKYTAIIGGVLICGCVLLSSCWVTTTSSTAYMLNRWCFRRTTHTSV